MGVIAKIFIVMGVIAVGILLGGIVMGVIAMGLLLWGMLLWESFKVNRVKLTLMRCPFTAQLGLCKVKNP